MSGGAFDYVQYRLGDAIHDIEEKLRKNSLTVQQNWNSISEDERKNLWDYERPWSVEGDHPWYFDDEARKAAYKDLGISSKSFSKKLTKTEQKEWNESYEKHLRKLIEDHNNSTIGPNFSPEVVEKIKEMIPTIKKAQIYLDRIDWLFSGDDNEESFLQRTEEDLKEAGLS